MKEPWTRVKKGVDSLVFRFGGGGVHLIPAIILRALNLYCIVPRPISAYFHMFWGSFLCWMSLLRHDSCCSESESLEET